ELLREDFAREFRLFPDVEIKVFCTDLVVAPVLDDLCKRLVDTRAQSFVILAEGHSGTQRSIQKELVADKFAAIRTLLHPVAERKLGFKQEVDAPVFYIQEGFFQRRIEL